jgi:hypothetical protein
MHRWRPRFVAGLYSWRFEPVWPYSLIRKSVQIKAWMMCLSLGSADALFICYAIDREMGGRHREAVAKAVSLSFPFAVTMAYIGFSSRTSPSRALRCRSSSVFVFCSDSVVIMGRNHKRIEIVKRNLVQDGKTAHQTAQLTGCEVAQRSSLGCKSDHPVRPARSDIGDASRHLQAAEFELYIVSRRTTVTGYLS